MKSQREKPVFTHPELEVFYQYDFAIPREKVEPLLKLPKETLVEDLGEMLNDAILHFEFFQEKGWNENETEFALHALWLLADLKVENSLDDVLKILRQDSDFLEFWFGDTLTEGLWEVVYHIGKHSLKPLKAFVLEPGNYTFARTAVTTGVEQIALHHPERRDEVVEWYGSIFESFLAMEDNDPSIDEDVISSMIGDILSFNGKELLPVIKKLYDSSLVFDGICGTYASIVEDMEKRSMDWAKQPVFSNIFERYEDAVSTWHYYRMKYDKDYRKKHDYPKAKLKSSGPSSASSLSNYGQFQGAEKPSTFERQGKKIGRNDPCPCGSGKKYKRCCGKKT